MERDTGLKRYFSDNERYADLVNGCSFYGRQVLKAEALTELDSQNGLGFMENVFSKKRKSGKPKYRDLIRKAAFGVNFLIIGMENQDEVNYLMPLRVMSYDVGEYEKQAATIRRIVKKIKGISKSEFLSGFLKDGKLHPCITYVLYYGENWDGSRDLHGILEFADISKELKKLVNNYKINLIEVRKFTHTEWFQTDLKQVFDFIRCSADKKKLKELVEQDAAFKEMDEEAYDVAVSFTGAEELVAVKKYHGKDGKVDMCKALTELLEDERIEGELEGENNIKQLYFCVLRDNRIEDFTKAMRNSAYLKKLYKEYHIK